MGICVLGRWFQLETPLSWHVTIPVGIKYLVLRMETADPLVGPWCGITTPINCTDAQTVWGYLGIVAVYRLLIYCQCLLILSFVPIPIKFVFPFIPSQLHMQVIVCVYKSNIIHLHQWGSSLAGVGITNLPPFCNLSNIQR